MKLIEILKDVHYIVTDDSEIKNGDYAIHNNKEYREQYKEKPIICTENNRVSIQEHWDKITHSTQPLEDMNHGNYTSKVFLDIKPLTVAEVEEVIYGYSVEKMAEEEFPDETTPGWRDSFSPRERKGYKVGFKAHQELVKDKLFSIEDMQKFGEVLVWNMIGKTITESFIKQLQESLLKTMLPKTEWECTFDEQGKLKLI
jgi:hypothetical protein